MAEKTRAELQAEAIEIRDEVVTNANTAIRVGTHLLNEVDSAPLMSRTALPPSVAPAALGDFHIDSASKKVYVGTDTVASSDFEELAKASDVPTDAVLNSDYDANTILAANVDDTPLALTIPEQTIVGRITGGNIDALTASEVRTLINVEDGADVTDSTNVDAAGATMNADTSLAGNGYFLDEDDMSSDDATKVPSQQSVKAYVDSSLLQVTGEDLTLSGAENLDLSTFDSFEGLLTGNTTITVSNTPASGITFTRNLIISGSVGTETLTLPGTWNIYGEYVVDEINYLTIEFANFTTNGLQVNCFINQPT